MTGAPTRPAANRLAHRAVRCEWCDGLKAVAPVAAVVMPVGLLFGALSSAKGLTLLEAGLMSILVFAGGAQIAAMDLWLDPMPVAAIALSTFLINARHVLMGLSLAPKTHAFSPRQRFIAFFFLTDEAWALSERRVLSHPLTPAFWFSLAVVIPIVWSTGTYIGARFGHCLGDPCAIGADFTFTALLISLIAGFTTSRTALSAVLASCVTATLSYVALGAPWHIVIGAMVGLTVAYLTAPRDLVADPAERSLIADALSNLDPGAPLDCPSGSRP
ncbi:MULTISPECIES: AzlC family ABC transporter permease [unclassified Chelatococcus]|uniref:AzlC family ABC transporter permease n=1 Tax=unclassified Chelatococcus TaxID=2638111 RepID=UPI001BCC0313|nr:MULTISPECIES: AzlC family ABC transporter permease [unclassified Chelatococcus]MBS7697928.1 AzlC family ABC transporter permease [Chelatococcus sp. YT9]MBX3558495.1 AzlC family ABC transporter permease [Chelatococcus sp.]